MVMAYPAAVSLLVAALLLPAVTAQELAGCPILQPEELGSLDGPSTDGLISPTYVSGDSGPNDVGPDIQILDSHIVCMSTGTARDSYRYLSVIVNYTCNGGGCESNLVVAQFDMSCLRPDGVPADGEPQWEMRVVDPPNVLASGESVRTQPADGNFSTVPRTDCQACLSPTISANNNFPLSLHPDLPTHCSR